jgi:hypothetical protein
MTEISSLKGNQAMDIIHRKGSRRGWKKGLRAKGLGLLTTETQTIYTKCFTPPFTPLLSLKKQRHAFFQEQHQTTPSPLLKTFRHRNRTMASVAYACPSLASAFVISLLLTWPNMDALPSDPPQNSAKRPK